MISDEIGRSGITSVEAVAEILDGAYKVGHNNLGMDNSAFQKGGDTIILAGASENVRMYYAAVRAGEVDTAGRLAAVLPETVVAKLDEIANNETRQQFEDGLTSVRTPEEIMALIDVAFAGVDQSSLDPDSFHGKLLKAYQFMSAYVNAVEKNLDPALEFSAAVDVYGIKEKIDAYVEAERERAVESQ
jgi:hypothetical protein